MFGLFQSVVDRVKAIFVADAALDFEAQFLSRQADRKADLLRKAAEFEKEGLKQIAQELRTQAEGLSIQRPLDAVLPAVAELGATTIRHVALSASPTNGDSHPMHNGDRPKAVDASTRSSTGRKPR